MSKYIVTAGNHSTDMGPYTFNSKREAKKFGRNLVEDGLPNGEGAYNIDTNDGRRIEREIKRKGQSWFSWF